MTGQVLIGGTDISDLVVDGTYQMDAVETFESWMDGNKLTHRSGSVTKINGSFDVVLCEKSGYTLSQFKTVIDNATSNGVSFAAVYVTNEGAAEAVDCYISLTSKEHILTASGFIDVITVGIKER